MTTDSTPRASAIVLGTVAALAVAVSGLAIAPQARGSTYGVHECTNEFPQAPNVAASISGQGQGYTLSTACPAVGYEVRSGGDVAAGAYGIDVASAPPGTQINRAFIDVTLAGASNNDGHAAQLFYKPVGGPQTPFGNQITNGTVSFSFDSATYGTGPLEFIGAGVGCTHAAANCQRRSGSYSQIRNMGFVMQDVRPPDKPSLGGSLLAGWVGGTKTLTYTGSDVGAGVAAGSTMINAQPLADFTFFCLPATDPGGNVGSMSPCPGRQSRSKDFDLAKAPFVQGDNPLTVCVSEFGSGPAVSCATQSAKVDTVAPQVAFTSQQDAQDPDKLVAPFSDATSGVAFGKISYRPEGGEWAELDTTVAGDHLEARVDSAKLKPGVRYDFQATAIDRAGNATTTNLRADGSQMSVVGPLRTITDVTQFRVNGRSRVSVGYAKGGVVTGKVIGRDGSAVGGAVVKVRQKLAPGAKGRGETLSVEARPDGRFRAVLPAGPSRSLTASYAGDRRYLGSHSGELKLAVRAKVGLAVRPRAQAGGSVNFTGKLKARGAKIPKAGKRLEVQVKIGPKWKTVGKSTTTDRKGAYRLHYRFTADYEQPVRFTFRTVVPRERSWPYQTAISKQRQVVVHP